MRARRGLWEITQPHDVQWRTQLTPNHRDEVRADAGSELAVVANAARSVSSQNSY